MKKTCLLLFCLMLSALFSRAQYSLNGIVKDKLTGTFLSGANVLLKDSRFSGQTGINGNFSFTGISAGKYDLQVSYLGYRTYYQEININSDKQLEILLEPVSILSEGVIIRGTRLPDKAPATYTRLSKTDLEKNNTGQDLPFVIRNIPSAVVTSDGGTGVGYTGIRIRGTDMTRINVTVNGIPFNDPESHEVYWVDIPDIASSIDNIEIQRGVGTSTNGASSFGASINIQTDKIQTRPFATSSSAFGSFNTLKSTLCLGTGLISDHFSFEGRLSRISTDGYIDRATASLKSYFLSGTYLGKNFFIKTNIFSGKERTYQAWDGIPSNILDTNRTYNLTGSYIDGNGRTQFYKNEVDDYQQDHYQLFGSVVLSKGINLNLALHYTHGEGYYEQYKQEQYEKYALIPLFNLLLTTDLVTRKWLRNDFYGITYSLTMDKKNISWVFGGAWNQYLGDHFGKVIWTSLPFVQRTYDYQWYFNEGAKNDANVFCKGLWSINEQYRLMVDVQYRHIDYSLKGKEDDFRDITQHHLFDFFNPKAGIVFQLTKDQSVNLNIGMANREPNRSNYQDAEPGLVPKPEQLYNVEFGYNLNFKRLHFSSNLYYMDYSNQLVLTGKINSVGAAIMSNVPRSYRTGIELVLQTALLSWLDWESNITLSRNKVLHFTEYIDNWDEGGQIVKPKGETNLSFSPEIIANSSFSAHYKHFSCQLLSKYIGKQYIDNTSDESRRLHPYLVNDLKLSYQFSSSLFQGIECSLLINNVLDEKYETNAWVYRYYYEGSYQKMDGYFPQAFRNYLLGLTIKM
ncbi:MAG: TonB-dependent receptor [Bacteroidetes bacterium]|nr:TonB-dependent receptor [Bacteroidota bacterium]